MIKISYLEGNKLFMLQIFIRVTSLLSLILLSQSWLIFLDISWIKLINIPNKFPQYVNEFDSTNISHCDNTNRYNNDFTLRKYLKSKQLITSQIGKLIIILLSWYVEIICKTRDEYPAMQSNGPLQQVDYYTNDVLVICDMYLNRFWHIYLVC